MGLGRRPDGARQITPRRTIIGLRVQTATPQGSGTEGDACMPGRKSEVNTVRSVLIFLVTVLLSPALGAAAFIPADDENILYTGRWDDSNPIEPWAYAKGTSVIAIFSGTSLSASISATTTDYLRIIIDGD